MNSKEHQLVIDIFFTQNAKFKRIFDAIDDFKFVIL